MIHVKYRKQHTFGQIRSLGSPCISRVTCRFGRVPSGPHSRTRLHDKGPHAGDSWTEPHGTPMVWSDAIREWPERRCGTDLPLLAARVVRGTEPPHAVAGLGGEPPITCGHALAGAETVHVLQPEPAGTAWRQDRVYDINYKSDTAPPGCQTGYALMHSFMQRYGICLLGRSRSYYRYAWFSMVREMPTIFQTTCN